MQIEVLTVSPFAQNARILICEETKEAVIVDPGDEADRILAKAQELNADLKAIWATHGHIDHIGAVKAVQEKCKLPFYMHKADMPLLETLPMQAAMFGVSISGIPQVDHFIEDNGTIEFGKCQANIIFIPGHSPGSVGFLFGKDLIGGDALFAEGIGRTDLPGGDFEILRKSIVERLYSLPEETIVHTGHGSNTTIGHEKRNNPFVRV